MAARPGRDGSTASPEVAASPVMALCGVRTVASCQRPRGSIRLPTGGGEDPNNWRNLLQRASYEPSDSGEVARDAMLDTPRRVVEVREAIDRLGTVMRTMALSGSGSASVAGFGGGGGEGGGNANLRYGRGTAGGFRSTPGTGSYGNPSKSLLDLIAKSEGAGYNVSWGNGRFLPRREGAEPHRQVAERNPRAWRHDATPARRPQQLGVGPLPDHGFNAAGPDEAYGAERVGEVRREDAGPGLRPSSSVTRARGLSAAGKG